MASFKSYATPGAFNPFQVPDESQKMRNKADEQIKLMQRDLALLKENNQVSASLKREGQNLEASSQDRAFRADTAARGAYRDQLVRNYQTELQNIENENANRSQTLKLISDFSQTAMETYGAFQKAKEKGMKDAYTLAVYDTGVTAAEAMEIAKLDSNMSISELGRQQIVQKLAERGVSMQQIQYLRQTGGSKRFLESKALLQQTIAQFPTEMMKRGDEMITLPDGRQMSLNQSLAMGDPAAYQTISGQLTRDFIRSSGLSQMNPQLVGAEGFPAINRYWANFGTKVGTQSRTNSIAQAKATRQDVLSLTFNNPGAGGGVQGQWAQVSSLTGAARTQALDDLFEWWKNASATGAVTKEQWDFLKSQPAGDGMTFEQRFSSGGRAGDFLAIQKAVQSRITFEFSQYENQQKGMRIEAQKAGDMIFGAIAQGQQFSDADIEAAIEQQKKLYNGNYDTRLDNIRTTTDIATDQLREQAEFLLRNGSLSTDWLLNTGNQTIIGEFSKTAASLDRARVSGVDFKQVEKEMLMLAQSPNQLSTTGSTEIALQSKLSASRKSQQLMQNFRTYFADNVNSGQTPEAAAANAQERVIAEFTNKYLSSNSASQFTQNGQYKDLIVNPADVNANTQAVQDRLAEVNKSIIESAKAGEDVLDKPFSIYPSIEAIESASKGYGTAGWQPDGLATYTASKLGINPIAVLNQQRIAAGLDELKLPPSMQAVDETVSPAMQSLINTFPTPQRSTRAMGSTQAFDSRTVKYGDLIQQSASQYGVNPTQIAALMEIESGFNPGATSRTGAIGLMQIQPDAHPLYNGGKDPAANIDYGTQYYAQLVQQFGDPVLAAGAYNAGPGRMLEHIEQGRPLPAETVEHMRKFSQAMYKYGDVSQLSSPNTMRPSMAVYVTGNIGPTSTGPHLDVKQVGGGRFEETALDNYVEVEDPEFGRISLGELRQRTGGIGDSFDQHLARGSHGIDYGTHSGTEVFLKNGAKVVGSQPSAHGDVLTIQLPNGQQYTFLHGKSN